MAESTDWTTQRCVPCEGGIPVVSATSAASFCAEHPGWELSSDGHSISRKLNCGRFTVAVSTLNQIGDLAEREQHHPDLHLTGYRHLRVVLTTHAIGGLSENDFIMAAKIDALLDNTVNGEE
ncbi:MAG: 4a-hydroxytetrahydrobiopterin dehydratase [Planctomycetota bacterium]